MFSRPKQEGVVICVSTWLGGMRAVLLMQSSGVGNFIDMISLPTLTKAPVLMLVITRGKCSKLNLLQILMVKTTPPFLAAIDAQSSIFFAEMSI